MARYLVLVSRYPIGSSKLAVTSVDAYHFTTVFPPFEMIRHRLRFDKLA